MWTIREIIFVLSIFFLAVNGFANGVLDFKSPSEEHLHEGSWILWPENVGDNKIRKRVDSIGLKIVRALHTGENIHVIVKNSSSKKRLYKVFSGGGVNMERVDFKIWNLPLFKINGNRPLFVYDRNDQIVMTHWNRSSELSMMVGKDLNIKGIAIGLCRGNSYMDIDGKGTLMGIVGLKKCKEIADIEGGYGKYLGIKNFIWIKGTERENLKTVKPEEAFRFGKDSTIVTIEGYRSFSTFSGKLENAKDTYGKNFNVLELPVTSRKVNGANCFGSYLDYYVGNEVVLVPEFKDSMDENASEIIQRLYPDRIAIGIDSVILLQYGLSLRKMVFYQPMSR